MTEKNHIGVFGSGAFGTALAEAFAQGGNGVRMWARNQSIVDEINSKHQNTRYSAEKGLSPSIVASTNFEETLEATNTWIYACPSSCIGEFFSKLSSARRGSFKDKQLINTAKGFDVDGLRLHHHWAADVLGEGFVKNSFFCLSGPSFAQEILDNVPTCLTLAGSNAKQLSQVQTNLSQTRLRLYTTTDIIGAEIGGGLKNVLAIAAGAVEGMKLGYNAQAAMINLGLSEMARIGVGLGARQETFLGFSGVGDLILTCTSDLSRNRRFGVALGRGLSIDEAHAQVGSTIEGFRAAEAAVGLAQKAQTQAPICEEMFKILHQGKDCKNALEDLLSNPPREEWI